jgi:hypothetical protein
MKASPDLGIRGQLQGFVTGKVPLRAFQEWFVDALWLLEDTADDETAEQLYRIENRLAEHSSGYISEAQLRDALRPLLEGPVGA